MVMAAARKMPSMGFSSQAKRPTTSTTSWAIAQHRGDTEGPLEADREVEQLGEERDAEGDERVVAQLLAERGADALVVDLLDVAADLGEGSSSIRCSSSLLISPVRTVKSAVSAVCTTASGKPASATASRAWSTVMSWLTE